MKKAAFILLLSSSAFAVTPGLSTTQTPVQAKVIKKTLAQAQAGDSQDTASTDDSSQDPNLVPSSTMKQRTPMDPTVSAASAGYANALAKRRPKKSLAVNLPSDPGIKAPKFGDWELKAQLRNDLSMANVQELQKIGGQNFDLNNEVRIGLKHKSGWGFSLTASYDTSNFADPTSNKGVTNDASLIVYHPSLIKNNTFDLYGLVRFYAPTSETSRENDVRSAAYWSFLDITLPKKFSMSNTFFIRGYTQDNEAVDTVVSKAYNSLELYHQSAKGISLAFGGQFEADSYHTNPTATEFDLYPFVDITLIPNVLIEPKYYFPIFVSGGGTVNASAPAINQTSAELFIKIAI